MDTGPSRFWSRGGIRDVYLVLKREKYYSNHLNIKHLNTGFMDSSEFRTVPFYIIKLPAVIGGVPVSGTMLNH